MRRRPVEGAEEVAAVVHRLAVLLSAGVAPAAAWHYLSFPSPVVAAVRAAGADGVAAAVHDAAVQCGPVAARAWRAVAVAWRVATDAGAPLAPALRSLASMLRGLAEVEREISVALAAPRATARLVLALPVVGVLFGVALGFDTPAMLFGTPMGWACLTVGGCLMFVGSYWMRRMVARAAPDGNAPGIESELLAIAVSGGAALGAARDQVREALARAELPGDGAVVEEIIALASSAGVPAAELLRAEAEESRRRARAESQRRATALGVRLMLPLGVCVLPAFMVLGVVPLIVTVVSSTVLAP